MDAGRSVGAAAASGAIEDEISEQKLLFPLIHEHLTDQQVAKRCAEVERAACRAALVAPAVSVR